MSPVLVAVIAAFIVLNAVIGMVTYVTLLERKFAARMQSRIGPYRVGPHGLLQPIADAIKLMMKEDVVPTAADKAIYNLAPIVFLLPCMLIFATIPFAPGLGVADLNIGILFFLAVSAMEIVGLFMAGWGSNNKYALLSAMRAVNQVISYDLPFIFAALVPVVLAGSLRLSDIAAAQSGLWFVFYPVIGQLAFIAFVVSTVAAENRAPFDILEAESELVAGFRVEYSGMKFALIQLGEYAHIVGSSFLGALLFLGAWAGPGPEWLGPIWFLLKAIVMFLVVTWVRWSFVRIRVDQILALSWKALLPATLLLLISTAIVVVLRVDGTHPGALRVGPAPERHQRRRDRARHPRRDARDRTESVPQAGHGALPDHRAQVSRPVPRAARARLREGHRRGSLYRLPPVRVRLPAGRHQGRDAEEREAELCEELHAGTLRLRVLRALRAGLPDRRHRDDEVLRSVHDRSARDAARQGSAARHRPAAPAVVGHGQQAARYAGTAEDGASGRARPFR
jgi:NADH-quinone oxidoreductase subunit H